jgi:hypothetical protein
MPTTAKHKQHKYETQITKDEKGGSLKIKSSRGRIGSPNEKTHVDPQWVKV